MKKKLKNKKNTFGKRVQVKFYLTAGEKLTLTKKAKGMGISRSELIKSTLKGSHLI